MLLAVPDLNHAKNSCFLTGLCKFLEAFNDQLPWASKA